MKLYWKIKKDGKWTWRSASAESISEYTPEEILAAVKLLEEE